jgi:hypothetical protein
MTESDIIKWGEIQYITGRLDELYYKAIPNVIDLHGSRKLDVRVGKYLDKLKEIDELAHLTYITARKNREYDKKRGQKKIASLLFEILDHVNDEDLRRKIENQIRMYKIDADKKVS